jgi:hypothetical protein
VRGSEVGAQVDERAALGDGMPIDVDASALIHRADDTPDVLHVHVSLTHAPSVQRRNSRCASCSFARCSDTDRRSAACTAPVASAARRSTRSDLCLGVCSDLHSGIGSELHLGLWLGMRLGESVKHAGGHAVWVECRLYGSSFARSWFAVGAEVGNQERSGKNWSEPVIISKVRCRQRLTVWVRSTLVIKRGVVQLDKLDSTLRIMPPLRM